MLKGDKIYVEDLRVKATIGIFDWEKKIKQEVSISYEIPHDNKKLQQQMPLRPQPTIKASPKQLLPLLKTINLNLLKHLPKELQRWSLKISTSQK